ncbi:MAG: hypothetical protein K2X87_03525, partial [Gemmataceae bacterium]|nr:hypothetical protein [Gemmataceae bacterium]
MSVLRSLSLLAVRHLADKAGAAAGVGGFGQPLVRFLHDHLTDHSKRLADALDAAVKSAWTALEVALAGDTVWTRLARAEDAALRAEVRAFLDAHPLAADDPAGCLAELRDARAKGLLSAGRLDPAAVRTEAGRFNRLTDPAARVAAEWDLLDQAAQNLAPTH